VFAFYVLCLFLIVTSFLVKKGEFKAKAKKLQVIAIKLKSK